MNILIGCVGRQVYLVNAFKSALEGKGLVIGMDTDKYSPALSVCDKHFISPPYADPEYTDWLVSVCADNKIDLVLSLNENELFVLEGSKGALYREGCTLVGAPSETMSVCSDKWKLNGWLMENGVSCPPTSLLSNFCSQHGGNGSFVVKPRFGRGSKGVLKDCSGSDVERLAATVSDPDSFIVQKMMAGDFYSFDVVNDLNSLFACCLVRRRLKMGAEETQVAITEDCPLVHACGRMLSGFLRHQGLVDVEGVLWDGVFHVFDINIRFGGGYPFSHIAGSNIPLAIIRWRRGEPVEDSLLCHELGVVSAKNFDISRVTTKA